LLGSISEETLISEKDIYKDWYGNKVHSYARRLTVDVWIALLRGINVSGRKTIRMEALRQAFESLRYRSVSTYIQSGNVVFGAGGGTSEVLQKEIAKKLVTTFGFKVPVIVKSLPQVGDVIKRNPFKGVILKENEKIYVAFLACKPAKNARDNLMNVSDSIDKIRISGDEIYLLCRKGYATTQFSNTFLEKQLGVVATTRNWATVNKLWEIGNEAL
jgi:uncharacterized protein (DUF1697 family)